MRKHILLFLSTSIIILSCVNTAVVYREVMVDNQYTLTVPDYLHPCSGLHKKASLQLQNLDDDLYVIVIDEKKITLRDFDVNYSLKTYFDNVIQQPFVKNIKYPVINKYPKEIKIAGNKALMSTIKGLVNNRLVFYKFAIIETPNYFYQIIIWTRDDKKEKLENEMQKIIESFREEKKEI